MKISIISVGKAHDKSLIESIETFTKRSHASFSAEWVILPTSTKDKEGLVLLHACKKEDYVVLLDEKGSEMTSIGLAEILADKMSDSTKRVVFIIGGAFGVSDTVKERANYIWSLSKLTFPHMLVRLILIEQLYRASSIINNGKYHHE
jgi:23S rRNA (pseudouridine1915-N3)-methyltransferase